MIDAEPQTVEEWGAFCAKGTRAEHQYGSDYNVLCLSCARAYAQQQVEAWKRDLEESARLQSLAQVEAALEGT